MKGRREPKQERSKATFEAITTAAARILAEESYEALSTNKIAAVAGVGIGSFYEYFSNKDAVLITLLDKFSQTLTANAAKAFEAAYDMEFADGIGSIARAFISTYQSDPDLYAKLILQAPFLKIQNPLDLIEPGFVNELHQFLTAHEASVNLRDPKVCAAVSVRIGRNLIDACCTDRSFALDLKDLEPELVALVLGYVSKYS